MNAKTPAQRVRDVEAKKRAAGLVEIRVWVRPAHIEKVRAFARSLIEKVRRPKRSPKSSPLDSGEP